MVKRRDHSHARVLAAVLGAAALALAACGSPPGADNGSTGSGPAKPPALPSKPVTLTVLDVSGDLVSTQALIKNFQKANPKLVKKVKFVTATSPELVGKIKAEQTAGHVDIDLVLTGNDGVAAGLKQNMWVRLFPNLAQALPNVSQTLTPVGQTMQQLAGNSALVNRASANGPLLQYNKKAVPSPPRTPQELLAWAKAHPGKFIYARPSNSGPGRTFLMALPYLLGDKDPADPNHGWDKTWAYLKDLGKYVKYYPSGTADTLKMLGSGKVDLIPSTTGFDVQARSDGTLPPDTPIALFDGQKWVADAHYMAIPRGGDKGRLAVTLELMKWILRRDQEALTFGTGNITPAVQGVDLSSAPASGQRFVQKWGRPDTYPKLLKSAEIVAPVAPDKLVDAFDRWDREIGAKS
jgi:putative spermidine/putrescine transport system substrate-binding protein